MARVIAARRTAVVPRGGAFAKLSIEELAAPVKIGMLNAKSCRQILLRTSLVLLKPMNWICFFSELDFASISHQQCVVF